MSNDTYRSVSLSQLVDYLKRKNEQDSKLLNLSVSGELSNVKVHGKGNIYFRLKEDKYVINGFMSYYEVNKLLYKPQDGDKVVVTGAIKYNQLQSNYQIVAKEIEKFGLGNLYIAFEKNKKMLEEQGYFNQEHKKPIPLFPKKIAIITGRDSAALKDMLKTIQHRYRLCEVIVFPSLVQGESAAKDIISLIHVINRYNFDVIILGRGGGSFEDLDAFNNVDLAKTIFESRIPIVTGIGHESDFTIADFVSDFRAATPTAAATKVTPDTHDLNQRLHIYQTRLFNNFTYQLNLKRSKLDIHSESKVLKDPNYLYLSKLQEVDAMYEALNQKMKDILTNNTMLLKQFQYQLEQNNINVKLQKNKHDLQVAQTRLNQLIQDKLTHKQKTLKELEDTLLMKQYVFNNQLESYKNKLENIYLVKLNNFIQSKHHLESNALQEAYTKLNLLNPLSILDKGYALVYQDNQLIKDYSLLQVDSEITIKNRTQSVIAKVEEVKSNE